MLQVTSNQPFREWDESYRQKQVAARVSSDHSDPPTLLTPEPISLIDMGHSREVPEGLLQEAQEGRLLKRPEESHAVIA